MNSVLTFEMDKIYRIIWILWISGFRMKPEIHNALRAKQSCVFYIRLLVDKPWSPQICFFGGPISAVRRMLLSRFHPETVINPVHPVDPVKKNNINESIPFKWTIQKPVSRIWSNNTARGGIINLTSFSKKIGIASRFTRSNSRQGPQSPGPCGLSPLLRWNWRFP